MSRNHARSFDVFTLQVWKEDGAAIVLPFPSRSTVSAWRETTPADLRRSLRNALEWLDTITIEEEEG